MAKRQRFTTLAPVEENLSAMGPAHAQSDMRATPIGTWTGELPPSAQTVPESADAAPLHTDQPGDGHWMDG